MADGEWTRYKLQRKLFSIGEDFWIENDRGESVFKVDAWSRPAQSRFISAAKREPLPRDLGHRDAVVADLVLVVGDVAIRPGWC
jgi:uncharacterized protein YxjI